MPSIMTAHIAQRSARCRTSQTGVIIHALAPVIGPYMSRANTTIHIQETSGRTISNTRVGVRWYRNADSITVSGRASGALRSTIDGVVVRECRSGAPVELVQGSRIALPLAQLRIRPAAPL